MLFDAKILVSSPLKVQKKDFSFKTKSAEFSYITVVAKFQALAMLQLAILVHLQSWAKRMRQTLVFL